MIDRKLPETTGETPELASDWLFSAKGPADLGPHLLLSLPNTNDVPVWVRN